MCIRDRYESLQHSQQQQQELSLQKLAAKRQVTQWYKLLHLRKLSRLKADLYSDGSSQDIESYERLIACESQPLKNQLLPQENSTNPLQATQDQE